MLNPLLNWFQDLVQHLCKKALMYQVKNRESISPGLSIIKAALFLCDTFILSFYPPVIAMYIHSITINCANSIYLPVLLRVWNEIQQKWLGH